MALTILENYEKDILKSGDIYEIVSPIKTFDNQKPSKLKRLFQFFQVTSKWEEFITKSEMIFLDETLIRNKLTKYDHETRAFLK